MADGNRKPATKGDLHKGLQELRKATQKDLKIGLQELRKEMHGMKDEILLHFDATVETIRHDLLGANHDEIEVIKNCVTRLEQHTRLVAS